MDRIRIGDSATPSTPLRWLRDHGYQAASFGTDGMSEHQGVLYSRSLPDEASPTELAFIGDTLVWDGQNITIERAP